MLKIHVAVYARTKLMLAGGWMVASRLTEDVPSLTSL